MCCSANGTGASIRDPRPIYARGFTITAGERVRSTASRAPLVLIYYEASVNLDDARRRERFLKTGKGKRYLNKLERH